MITRAWGTANGYRVVLTREGGNIWKFDVPSLPDGEHIVMELMAENDAGNIGYLATIMLIMTKHHEMRIKLVPRGYRVEARRKDNPYIATIKERGFHVERVICHRDGD